MQQQSIISKSEIVASRRIAVDLRVCESRNTSFLLSLSEIENNAAELVEANRVVGALGDLAQVVLNLGISVLDAEVVEALVKLLHLVELEHAVAVDVKGVKQLANLGLRHGKSADVAHVLCVDTTA
eukprot:TRINITY_DN2044_c0_g1_i2.p1 TRINITY_DN2044_c0_g1~~TRINITY_DN2044_c0_g1_i2.p1  ORF type:complete len:126 (-),score=5.88 TRINITY_DN2044_c0_g1_i2:5-382(-)